MILLLINWIKDKNKKQKGDYKMKKLLFVLSILLIALLAACGNDEDVIKIGATSTPHAEVLEKAKPILEE